MGVICCVDLDLGVVDREFRVHAVIDPCAFTLTVGFENEYFNVSLFSYTWGAWEKLTIGRVEVNYRIDKAADGRQFYLSATTVHQAPGKAAVTKVRTGLYPCLFAFIQQTLDYSLSDPRELDGAVSALLCAKRNAHLAITCLQQYSPEHHRCFCGAIERYAVYSGLRGLLF